MEISIQKLNQNAVIPTRGSKFAAGYDLYACIDTNEALIIKPHQTSKLHTGVAVAIPDGYFGGIYARSGVASKRGLRPANCVGVIDADYRGEIIVALHNDSEVEQLVVGGERIAQLVIMPFLPVDFKVVDELDDTDRGEGGFGSTGST